MNKRPGLRKRLALGYMPALPAKASSNSATANGPAKASVPIAKEAECTCATTTAS